MTNGVQKMTKEEFKRLNSYEVYTRLMGKNPPVGKPILSPLRLENNPSFNIFKDEKTAEYRFKDFGVDETGDCIKFVQLTKKTDFKGAIEILQHEFNCTISDDQYPKTILNNNVPAIPDEPKITSKNYSLNERTKFNQQEADYFKQYSIKPEIIKKYNVTALDSYTLPSGTTINRKSNELFFCYNHDSWAKIYKPIDPDRKYRFIHLGNKPPDFIFGFEQLPDLGDILILTGGEKDVMTLASLGYNAISLNSETSSFQKTKADDLKQRFDKIIVLYDIDDTGLKSSEKLCSQYGFKRCLLPDSLISEGGKDISDFIKFKHTTDELVQLINNSEKIKNTPVSNNLFIVKPITEFIEESKNKPTPQKLFDEFWFEGETCIMFSDTNYGKSTLALQIADSITKGVPIPGFEMTASRQKVIYLDFELSAKQIEKRYTDDNNHSYSFDDYLLRATIDIDSLQTGNSVISDDLIVDSIEDMVSKNDAKIIIIDNLTYLATETEKSKVAAPLMKRINFFKFKYGISILALGHTPKRDLTKAMTINDLQGSKMYTNFSDSIFAINQSSKDTNLKYIIQLKVRYAAFKFVSDNVAVCQLLKTDSFLGFEFVGCNSEKEHLKIITEKFKSELENNIIELHNSNPELSFHKIAAQLDTNSMKVKRVLDKLKGS